MNLLRRRPRDRHDFYCPAEDAHFPWPHPEALRAMKLAVRLVGEIDPDARLWSVAVGVFSGGQFIQYGIRTAGDGEITRRVFDGDQEALRRAEAALSEAFVDATPRDGL